MQRKYNAMHVMGAAAFGTVVGLTIGLPLDMKRAEKPQTIQTTPVETRMEETPVLSIIQEDTNFHTYRQIDFYDRNLDKKTVERYVITEYGDAGTGASSRIIADVDRSEMTEDRASRIDSQYQKHLAGELGHLQTLLVNRFN